MPTARPRALIDIGIGPAAHKPLSGVQPAPTITIACRRGMPDHRFGDVDVRLAVTGERDRIPRGGPRGQLGQPSGWRAGQYILNLCALLPATVFRPPDYSSERNNNVNSRFIPDPRGDATSKRAGRATRFRIGPAKLKSI